MYLGKEEKNKKEKSEKKKREENEKKKEIIIYKIKCKDCEKTYIGETKLKIEKRAGQHKKDVQFKRKQCSGKTCVAARS